MHTQRNQLLRAQVVEVDLQAVLPLALGREGEADAVVGHLRRTQKCCDDGAAWRGEEIQREGRAEARGVVESGALDPSGKMVGSDHSSRPRW